jgi:hypothetical protein
VRQLTAAAQTAASFDAEQTAVEGTLGWHGAPNDDDTETLPETCYRRGASRHVRTRR